MKISNCTINNVKSIQDNSVNDEKDITKMLRIYFDAFYYLESKINKPCYPITMHYTIVQAIQKNIIKDLRIIFNGLVLVSIDITVYPNTIFGNLFIPFYTDRYFNIYEQNLQYNDVYLQALDSNKQEILSERIISEGKSTTPTDFGARCPDGKFINFRISEGCLGMPSF